MAGRQTKENRKIREDAMIDIFKAEPDLSINKANEKFFARFGTKMRLARAYQLRTAAGFRKQDEANQIPLPILSEKKGTSSDNPLPIEVAVNIPPEEETTVQPPVDNEHVAEGCEQFTPEVIEANKSKCPACGREAHDPGTSCPTDEPTDGHNFLDW